MKLKIFSICFEIFFCSFRGGIGTMRDLTLSDLRFLTVEPAANLLSKSYIMEELSI